MPTPLSPRFQGPTADHSNVWNQLWKEQKTPWDRAASSPALVDLVQDERIVLFPQSTDLHAETQRRALVPGCGRGYDVEFLAATLNSKGYGFEEFMGLEVSPEAVAAATNYLISRNAPSSVSIELGDFFDGSSTAKWNLGVDLIYDYTFLCAIHPTRRQEWATRMAKLIKPGGVLITLQHPLDDHIGGPPFSLSPEIYRDLLSSHFDLELQRKPQRGFESESSKTDQIAVYRRKGDASVN